MICIFCRADSGASPVAVRMVPVPLGADNYLLPPGAVCGLCQEHLEREVDSPFVESAGLPLMRSTGREDVQVLAPPGPVVSRFLAKFALELMALQLAVGAGAAGPAGGVEYLAHDAQFDLIRYHARYGTDPEWPVHARRIYHSHSIEIADHGEFARVVHESATLHTPAGEFYFVSVMFGVEFAINYGGPEVERYLAWLRENNNASPLYSGLNARPLPVLSRSNEGAANN